MNSFENYIDQFYEDFDRLGVSRVAELLNDDFKKGELQKEGVIATIDTMLEYFKARED